MWEELKRLREERQKLHARQKEMLAAAHKEGRELNSEDRTEFDKIEADFGPLDARIDELRKLLEREDRMNAETAAIEARAGEHTVETRGANDVEDTAAQERGQGSMTDDEREERTNRALNQWFRNQPIAAEDAAAAFGGEDRALSHVTNVLGEHTIPEQFRNVLETAIQAWGGVRSTRATILSTAGGNPIPMPTGNDLANIGVRIDENTQVGQADPAFGQEVLNAYKYTSQLVLIPVELTEDSAFDIIGWVANALGIRLGRAGAVDFTVGDGVNKPRGCVPNAAATVTTAAAGLIAYDDVVDLQHAPNPVFRPGAEFMCNDNTVKALRKLKDNNGFPIWTPAGAGLGGREPDLLLGSPMRISHEMADPATGNVAMVFGDFSKFFIRDAAGFRIRRLLERYADFDQIGVLAFSRHDSMLMNAGATGPLNPLQALTVG